MNEITIAWEKNIYLLRVATEGDELEKEKHVMSLLQLKKLN